MEKKKGKRDSERLRLMVHIYFSLLAPPLPLFADPENQDISQGVRQSDETLG